MHRKFAANKLLLATNNPNKVLELKALLHGNLEIVTASDFGLSSPDETEDSYLGNAMLKAKYYGDKTGLIALADDTGVNIHDLDGAPGVHTADWLRDKTQDPNERIIAALLSKGANTNHPKASASCAVALYWPVDNHFETIYEEVPGYLDFNYKDIEGIGFRKIFVPHGFDKPLALLSDAELESVSHRAHAMKKLLNNCF